MSYQRVMWHSGLTYRCQCLACGAFTTYTDFNLGFRPWFADGFVYCAQCRRPVRHSENNAIKPDGSPYFPFPIRTPPPPGYVAYSIESLRIQQPYQQQGAPQQYPQQGAPQQYPQQPYPQQQPQQYAPQQYPQQPYPQQQPQQYPTQQYTQQQYTQQPYPQQPLQQPAPVAAPDPAAEMRNCPNCGRPYAVGQAIFCAGCGTKLIDEPPAEEIAPAPEVLPVQESQPMTENLSAAENYPVQENLPVEENLPIEENPPAEEYYPVEENIPESD